MRTPAIVSVNSGRATPTDHSTPGVTGIDKRPAAGPVEIRDPGPREAGGGSGVAGDAICDRRRHGGSGQAVYAYAREDLDAWEAELGRPLSGGVFGENLTTTAVDVTGALIGERWRVGSRCVLQVTAPRLPCRTFAAWLEDQGWVRRFTERGAPGAYLSVVVPGRVRAGDPVTIAGRPDHGVTIGAAFRALTTDRAHLPRLAAVADLLPGVYRDRVRQLLDRPQPRP